MAGLRPAPATGWSNSNSRSGFPDGWRGGSACGRRRKPVLGGLAAASMPRTLPQPDPPRLRQISAICPLFCRAEPCSAQISQISKYSILIGIHPHTEWIHQIAEICQRWGGVGVRGVSRMDAAAKPTWTYLRRPRTPAPPRHPTGSPLLLLLLLLPASGRHYHGCRAQPCRTNPIPRPGNPRSASAHRSARDAACPSASAVPATAHPPACPATGPAGCAPGSAGPAAGR